MTTTAQSLLPDFVIKQGLVNPCLTRGADFEVYTEALKVDENAESGHFVVSTVGSSTVQDLQGDTMTLTALDDMTRVPDNLLCFLNHSYQIPEDLFGGLYGKPWIQSSNGIADLHISIDAEVTNPRAAQTYNMIAVKKRRLGSSIGCMILDYEIDERTGGIIVLHVMTLEHSIVGIPANQRSWAEVGTKSLFERSLIEGRADDALKLAPAVRGMYWRAYDSVVKHVENDALKSDLERVRPRDTAPHKIMCVFTDSGIGFELSDAKGIKKSLKREDVGRALEENMVVRSANTTATILPNQTTVTDSITLGTETSAIQTETIESEDLDAKSVSGNTSFPLMDIGTEWTGSKAESQIFAYAKNDDGEINSTKAKACFLFFDPSNSDVQKGYKMPFCYVADGSPKIVPKGVQACAGVLNGGMGGVDAPGDQAGMKAKVKTLYGRINSQFKPDPEWVVPWEKEDKSMDGIETKAKDKEKDGIADSESDGPLNRQDTEEKPADDKDDDKDMPKASDVKVSADGTHKACKGVHSHSHSVMDGSQGDDKTHNHSHSHDGDANHAHSHDSSSKDAESEVTKSQDNVQASEETTIDKTLPEIDTKKLSLLSIYNSLGAELGFTEVTLDKEKSLMPIADGVDMQEVITRISIADSQIDWLMAVFGVPDIDAAGDNGAMTSTQPSTPFAWSLSGIATKSGKEISAKNGAIVQKIMHCSMALGAACPSCGATGAQSETVDEATDEARMQGEGQPIQQYPSMAGDTLNNSLTNSLEVIGNLTKSLESMTVKSIVKSEIDAALDESRRTLETLRQEQRTLIDNIRKLKELPLGRPTTLIGRTVVQEEGTASYDEMRQAGVNMLEQSDDDLEVVTRGSLKYRLWPKGFKSGQRPALTEMQKTFMSPLDYAPYHTGDRDVFVPVDERAVAP